VEFPDASGNSRLPTVWLITRHNVGIPRYSPHSEIVATNSLGGPSAILSLAMHRIHLEIDESPF
jgi:hypothetical protein